MTTIATILAAILAPLRTAIGVQVGRNCARFLDQPGTNNPARAAMLTLLWNRVGRMALRFERLVARWRAGTLPKPRPSRAGHSTALGVPPLAPLPTLPRRRAWLITLTQDEDRIEATGSLRLSAAGAGSQLRHLLSQAEMQEFLRAAPQAGRILRPLWRMLSADPPPAILLPPPRPAPPVPRPVCSKPAPAPRAEPPVAPPAAPEPAPRPYAIRPPPALRFSSS